MNKLDRYFMFLLAMLFAVAPGLSAAESQTTQGGAMVLSDSIDAKATVVKVNSKTREITLRNEQGEEVTVVASKEVRNFKQIKKGDIVEVNYHVAVATRLEKAESATAAGQATTIERAPAGSKPGAMATHTESIVATVEEIDHAKRILAARGPRGNVAIVKVPPEMKAFDQLKKGDRIMAVYSEAIAISVKTPPKKK